MSIKDWLIMQTAKDLEIDENVCDKVISWSYQKAREAAKHANSIELSGFGKLLFSPTKASRRAERALFRIGNLSAGPQLEGVAGRIEKTKEYYEYLKTRIDGFERSMAGMEIRPISTEGAKGDDKTDSSTAVSDMSKLSS